MMLRTAQFLSHHSSDAEDLAQEAMIKAYRSLDRLTDPKCIKPWLMTILRHCHTDRYRANKHKEASLDAIDFEPMFGQTAPAGLDHDVVCEEPEQVLSQFSDSAVIRALRSLPRDIRWTLLLVDVEGLDGREAAAVMNVPIGTIKSRLHRGREALREALTPVAKQSGFFRRMKEQEKAPAARPALRPQVAYAYA
jgi:RNA polymerase sigma-70 factor (ECF subfamily)